MTAISTYSPPQVLVQRGQVRIRFVEQAPPDGKMLREFAQPRRQVALELPLPPNDQAAPPVWPDPTDRLDVLLVAPRIAAAQPGAALWLATPDHPQAAPAVVIESDGATVHWRPGRALIQAPPERHAELLAGLIDFAYYEGQLRALEQALETSSADADADVALAYRIRLRDRRHWPRFTTMIERFAQLRLSYARLEPCLSAPARSLPRAGRRLMARLLRRADVEQRLQALTDRLETCEDLYEGANDRVADYRWYLHGHLLELGIVVFLLLEVVLLVADLWLRILEL